MTESEGPSGTVGQHGDGQAGKLKFKACRKPREAKSILSRVDTGRGGGGLFVHSINIYRAVFTPGPVPGIGLSAGNRATNKLFPDFSSFFWRKNGNAIWLSWA